MPNSADTLFYPFERGFLDLPTGNHVAWLNAQPPESHAVLNDDWRTALSCEQSDRVSFLACQKAGLTVAPQLADDSAYDATLIIATNHRGANEAMVVRACAITKPEGRILIAGGKTQGIQSLRKTIARHTDIDDVMAKYHAQVLWFAPDKALATALAVEPRTFAHGMTAAPGMFSHERIDRGSALLAEHFDAKLSGAIADFGCGWGYLAKQVAMRCAPQTLDLFDAHYPSLMAAQDNLADLNIPTNTHWLDLAAEPVARIYDGIVMNPPFHAGNKTKRSLGEAFIKAASKALKPGGRLLMVANTGLKYETVLEQSFSRFEEIGRRDGFKIITARR